jgi:phage terminase small subunit
VAQGGRPPKPVELRLIQGNPGKRPIPKNTPLPKGVLVMPTWLNGNKPTWKVRARKLWDEMVPVLTWLSAPDSFKLADWCFSQAENEQCGHSDWTVARRSEHRRLASELGLDPTARARMVGGGNDPDEPDEGESFFGSRS